MYLLTIVFGPAATTWALLFKDGKLAQEVFEQIQLNANNGDGSSIKDDFGQEVCIALPIHGTCLEDIEQTETAQVLRRVATERVNAKALGAMKADPTIRQAINAQQSQTPIFTPR